MTGCHYLGADKSRFSKVKSVPCLFDTGANRGVMNREFANLLGVKIEETTTVISTVVGMSANDRTTLDLLFPGGVVLKGYTVAITDSNFNLVLGMDIIEKVNFTLSAKNGQFQLSFEELAHIDVLH